MDLFWQKIEEAVALAPEIPTERRAAWLDEFCAGDAKLKAEIESLLAFENESDNFLETPISSRIAAILPADDEESFAGKQFGHYKIVREIGRGGMGAVFLAERSDGEFDQQVALKIVRQTLIDKESENRFRRERQILAALNHPNIAKLLDGGVSDAGEPFLVMEYVEGKPLTKFAENKSLSIAERLRLFLRICAAVAFAHQTFKYFSDGEWRTEIARFRFSKNYGRKSARRADGNGFPGVDSGLRFARTNARRIGHDRFGYLFARRFALRTINRKSSA